MKKLLILLTVVIFVGGCAIYPLPPSHPIPPAMPPGPPPPPHPPVIIIP